MSTIVVEQPRQSGMGTPGAVKSPAQTTNGTKEPLSNATPEPMDTSRKLVEQAKQRLQIQMQFVENARRKILEETHPDMTDRLQVLVDERDRLLHIAKQRSDYFERGTTVIFDYECDEANSEYDLHCEKLRQDMLEEIHHEMEILNDHRKGGHNFTRTTTRKTRSTRNKPSSDSGFALDTAQKIKKRAGGSVFQPLENKLGQLEIDQDVRELTNVYEATKKRRVEFDDTDDGTPVAKYYRNKFLYRDWIFQEGDEVYVLNYPASSEYAAVICGISATELLVLSEKGKHYRLVIMDIRQGRVVLTTLSSEQATSRDDFGDASP
ncbi:Thioredoxinlike protein [Phytophthora megakarya]|uniref:Thioredoxinlike protein n=1 Tax=Phytophthora megakarya TaxID=4795 RepID=A0A225WA93_9STRA|nr:Thioredoxinlike protein [Phytophthora megakarya]